MTIVAGQTARADDFIDSSSADATPANDNGRVPKLEQVEGDDAKIARQFIPTKYTVQVFGVNAVNLGSATSQYDITNPSGSTMRYTWDGNGTNPSINSTSVPVGSWIRIVGQDASIANTNLGMFEVTGSGSNYFEVTNASGTPEINKNITTALTVYKTQTWTKPTGCKYVLVEVQGGGASGESGDGGDSTGDGGGGGGYARKLINADDLGATETVFVGGSGLATPAGTDIGISGAPSYFTVTSGTDVYGNGGKGTHSLRSIVTAGGTATGGDINIEGQAGGDEYASGTSAFIGGKGGDSFLGFGGVSPVQGAGKNGTGYGSGGSGAGDNGSEFAGGTGKDGVVIVTEYY